MTPEQITIAGDILRFIGLGVCFMVGVWVVSIVWVALSAALKCNARMDQIEKLFSDCCEKSFEMRKHYDFIKKEYPIKDADKK